MVKKWVKRSEFARLAGTSAANVTKLCATQLKRAVEGKRIDANHPDAVAYLAKRAEPATPEPASGVDPRYEEAVEWSRENSRYSIIGLQRALRVGYNRAARLVAMMKAAEILVEDKPAAQKPKSAHVRGHAAAREKKKLEAPPPAESDDGLLYQIPADIQSFSDMSLRELINRFGTDTRFCDWLKATKDIEDINAKRLKNAATEGTLVSRELVRTGVIDPFNAALLRIMTDGAKTIASGVIAKHASGSTTAEVEAYVSEILGSFIRPVKNKVQRTLRDA